MTGQAILQPGWLQAVSLHGTVAAPRAAAGVRIQLPHPGRPAPYPTLLVAIFDDSGSVAGPVGSDPLSGHYEEARRAFEVIARRGATHELGVVLHFDIPCSGDMSPTPLVRRSLLAVRGALRVPHDGAGSSELGPSLQRAHELAAEYPNHQATLVVFSDFLLLDAEPGDVLRELAAFAGDVHAVVLGGRLTEGVLAEHIQRTDITQEDQPGALALALFGSLIRLDLRRETVDVHLEVLIRAERSDDALREISHSVNRFALPDADTRGVIIGRRVDGQAEASGKTSFERLLFGGLEALWILNTMNGTYEHGSSKIGDMCDQIVSPSL